MSQILLKQIVKFGFVGALSFVVDFGIYTLAISLGCNYLIAGVLGFTISVICNYILSMKYVFVNNRDMSKQSEFIIFVVLSVIGLLLNEFLLWLFIDKIYYSSEILRYTVSTFWAKMLAKVMAVGIVMVYNFVTRKCIFEGKKREELCQL